MKKGLGILLASVLGLSVWTACDEDDAVNGIVEVFPVGNVSWASDVTEAQRAEISKLIGSMVKVETCRFYMGAQIKSDTLPNYFAHFSKADTATFVGPVLTVTMPDFYIGRYEITQGQWNAVMSTPPTGNYCKVESLKGTAAWYDVTGKGDDVAAYNISYDDALAFVAALNAKTGLTFRLPTEAEWECAARGGKYSEGYRYSGSNVYADVAWCYNNDAAYGLGNSAYGVHAGGELAPNELGLYDMTGNVSEWVANSYYKYKKADAVNPQGVCGGDTLLMRGGSWVQKQYTDFALAQRKKFIRSSYLNVDGSYSQSFYDAIAYCGFRIVLTAN